MPSLQRKWEVNSPLFKDAWLMMSCIAAFCLKDDLSSLMKSERSRMLRTPVVPGGSLGSVTRHDLIF